MMAALSALVSAVSAATITACIGFLVIVAAAAVAGAIARGGRRERAADAYQAIAASRFTIPVSLIVPAGESSSGVLSNAVASLLALNYSELEVVVVADSSAEGTLAALRRDWALEPKELFYRRTLHTSPVTRIFSSERDPRLVVIEKAPSGRADALNCGVSFARYRYVVSVSPDVVCDRDALLRLMSPALRDPGEVLAVTSYVERKPSAAGLHGHMADAAASVEETRHAEWARAGDDYQRLASIRSWMASRLAWHQLRCGLPPRDGVTAWRRDAVMEFGGFSLEAADPELDLLVRLQTAQLDGPTGRVVRTSEVFGQAPTLTIRGAAARAARRQRALFEALRTFRQAPSSAGGRAERRTMKIVVAVELLIPVAQAVAAVLIVAGAMAGLVAPVAPWVTFLLLAFGYGVVSASALLLRGGTPGAPSGADLKRLLIRAPLEFAVYRPALVWARLAK
jgi:cellulose synthase/poly-beta-1,6-N-acetylglucosamine synthase-like glycosyltransferase